MNQSMQENEQMKQRGGNTDKAEGTMYFLGVHRSPII